jgi:uncharacterized protein YbjT (DUF2867 family)
LAFTAFASFCYRENAEYRISAIHVEDFAGLALKARGWPENKIVDAVGPESLTFIELVKLIKQAVGSRVS